MAQVVTKPKTDRTKPTGDFVVADLSLADWGRKEIAIAEHEMPGLMAIRRKYAPAQPLKGARIAGSLHMTIQTAVLIETLQALGADIRWASCNIFSTQDHAAAAIAAKGTPVFAKKGETLEEYWDYTHRILQWADGGTPNLILDDGGDATLLIHLGCDAEKDAKILDRHRRIARKRASSSPPSSNTLARRAELLQHASPRTSSASARKPPPASSGSYKMASEGKLLFPAINVNDCVTKSKFDNLYGCRESPDRRHQAGHRRDDLAARRPSCAATATSARAAPRPSAAPAPPSSSPRSIPICALQACMEGFQVVTMDDACKFGDIFVTTTGNVDVITRQHMDQMKHNAIVCNIGHFDSEIQIAALERPATGKRSSRRSITSSGPTASASSSWPRAGWSTSAAPPATRASS